MRRRELITLLSGTAAAWLMLWPDNALAQQADRMRRVGILMPYAASDTEIQTHLRAFRQELQKLGWTDGGNIQFDEHWTGDDMELVRANAANLLELKPDVIFALGGRVIPVLMMKTSSVPIVFPSGGDPVGTGWVKSLARPGGNVTGFSTFEFSVVGKMMEMLLQIAPSTSRVAFIYNPDNPNAAFYARSFEGFAASLSIKPNMAPIHGIAEIERALENLVTAPNGGVFSAPDITMTALRDPVVALVARHRLPAIYPDHIFIKSGGLMSYAADRVDLFRRAASYVDRILRGEKPGDLPVQQPTKYELRINLKTAKALGLQVPPALLAMADEAIE
jgi:putative tryptophan/tyrosine transport system substrate-binding protein